MPSGEDLYWPLTRYHQAFNATYCHLRQCRLDMESTAVRNLLRDLVVISSVTGAVPRVNAHVCFAQAVFNAHSSQFHKFARGGIATC